MPKAPEEIVKATEKWLVEHRRSSKYDWVEIASQRSEARRAGIDGEYQIDPSFLARVKVSGGGVLNLGRLDHRRQYESVRFSFAIEIPCHADKIDDVRAAATQYVDDVVECWIGATEASFEEGE